jgi:zinc protease
MHVPFTKLTLENGLDVIVHEDDRVPLAAVNLWYHVGSKHERPGQTGLAHLFEHLMFEGSEHQPRGYFAPLQEAGATLNGSTSTDRTNYWELVPKDALDRALWMEADRLGWLLPAVTEERLNTQRAVVLNERRQNYENRPYGLAQFAIMEALYPPEHPYHWPTIGWPSDLEAARLADVHAFFSRHYHPANASLVIAGDVRSAEVVDRVRELFGGIPAGPPVPLDALPPSRAKAVRLALEDRVELARRYLTWDAPQLFAPGDAELDLMADLLANGRTARLYRRLVHDERVAVELAASEISREHGSQFQIVATAAPGRTLDEIEHIVMDEIARFAADGPTEAELERGRAEAEAAFLFRIEPLAGFGGRADQLNAYNVYQGNPDGFSADLARYTQTTPERLQTAAARWLRRDRMVALSVVPTGRRAASLRDSEPVSWTLS